MSINLSETTQVVWLCGMSWFCITLDPTTTQPFSKSRFPRRYMRFSNLVVGIPPELMGVGIMQFSADRHICGRGVGVCGNANAGRSRVALAPPPACLAPGTDRLRGGATRPGPGPGPAPDGVTVFLIFPTCRRKHLQFRNETSSRLRSSVLSSLRLWYSPSSKSTSSTIQP